MNESNGSISAFPFEYNAVQGRFTKLELSCLGTAFGFPPDLFEYADTERSDVVFNPGIDGNDNGDAADTTRWTTVADIQAILVPGGPLNDKMNRTANTMDGAYNAKAVNAGIGLINQRLLTFADCRAGSIAFNLYQGGHAGIPLDDFIPDKSNPAVIFERRELIKAFKLAGRAGAPKFVSKTLKRITNSNSSRLPERLHYYDFLVLLSRLPSLGQMRGDLDEPDNYITDDLYELCDFEDLMLTGDQRRGRRLSQSYELQLSRTPSPTKLDDGSDARRHPTAAASKSSTMPPGGKGGKHRRDMGRHPNTDSEWARRRGPRVDSCRPDDGLVASVRQSISIRRQSLGNNDDPPLKRPGTARTLRKTRSSISLPSATPTSEAWHAKGRKTGVRFDKGTKESDITFDTYWEESQKKLSESWVLKMPRWQDHMLHGLVSPKGNACDRRMSSAQALEQFFRYQGRPPSERLVTSDQVLEAETTTEDLRWRIDTKNYRKPMKAAVQPASTDWGALHPSAKLGAGGEGGNHAVDENNQGETLTSLFLKQDSQFGTGPQFHPTGASDFGSDDEYSNSQGSIGNVNDLSGDEGGDNDRRRSSISSNSGVHNSLAKKGTGHLKLVMNANGRPEMVPVDGGTGRPGSGGGGGGRTASGSRPGSSNAKTGSLPRGSGMPKKARIRTEIKPKRKAEAPKLLQRNWKVVGDWS